MPYSLTRAIGSDHLEVNDEELDRLTKGVCTVISGALKNLGVKVVRAYHDCQGLWIDINGSGFIVSDNVPNWSYASSEQVTTNIGKDHLNSTNNWSLVIATIEKLPNVEIIIIDSSISEVPTQFLNWLNDWCRRHLISALIIVPTETERDKLDLETELPN